MRAMVCRQLGAPDALRLEEVESRPLNPGEVRVRVKATGVNFADNLMIAGTYQVKPPPPLIPGLEAAGVVSEVAPGVKTLAVGDRVVGLTSWGGYAEEVVWTEERFLKIPEAMDFTTAAAFSLTYGTSHIGLIRRARLKAGETLVVHGAGGAVGLAAVEVGKKLGATVIATAGSAAKLALARDHGASHLINYAEEDLKQRLLEVTNGRGVDVIFDPVGGAAFQASLKAIAFEGRLIIVGFASGEAPRIPANHLLVKNVDIIGLFWGGYKRHDLKDLRASLEEVMTWWRAGEVKPHIGRTFPLAEAASALDYVVSRQSAGKVVLTL